MYIEINISFNWISQLGDSTDMPRTSTSVALKTIIFYIISSIGRIVYCLGQWERKTYYFRILFFFCYDVILKYFSINFSIILDYHFLVMIYIIWEREAGLYKKWLICTKNRKLKLENQSIQSDTKQITSFLQRPKQLHRVWINFTFAWKFHFSTIKMHGQLL